MSRPWRVCLDLTLTQTHDRFGGFARFGLALLEHLLALPTCLRSDLELLALTRADGPVVPANRVRVDELTSGLVLPRTEYLRQRRGMQRQLSAAGVDLFHSLYPEGLPHSGRFKVVATVYDLVTDVLPTTGSGPLKRLGRRVERWWEFHGADHLIAISETTRADARRLAGVRPERIDVVPLGVDSARFVGNGSEARPDGRHALDGAAPAGLPERYFLSVGSDHYRKNQWRLFEAWRQVSERIPQGLVLVGRQIYGDVFSRISSEVVARTLGARVVWLPDVDDEALPGLYRRASALVAPSLYEGFGMTLLEAMACGTPVIASAVPAHREVAGDAAVYFDPLSVADLASALERIVHDADLQDHLPARGRERVRLFTWEACALGTLRVYRKVLAPPGSAL
jgi:alpha-1,3-rhamnosyl/mannosyltransferase